MVRSRFYPILEVKIILTFEISDSDCRLMQPYGAHALLRRNVIDYIPDPRGAKTPVQRRISSDYAWPISLSAFLLLVRLASLAGTRHGFSLIANQFPS